MPVHYCGYPCDMDPIMALAEKYGIKVIEDVSHAHGGRYKGRLVGTIGHIGAMSVMSGKSLAVGEGGMIVTDDRRLYERAVAWGHYERTAAVRWSTGEKVITEPDLVPFAGLPWGGYKYRMHQLSSAGRVRHYRERVARSRAMNYFWDLVMACRVLRAPTGAGPEHHGRVVAARPYRVEELGVGGPVCRGGERDEAARRAPTSLAPAPAAERADTGTPAEASLPATATCASRGSLPSPSLPDACQHPCSSTTARRSRSMPSPSARRTPRLL